MQWQLGLTCVTGVLIAALSWFLISDAVRGAESVLLADASRAVAAAVDELTGQSSERAAIESDWAALAPELKDVSLRGVSNAVLRSYPGVEGGYWTPTGFLGYSFPTHVNPDRKTDVPSAESAEIVAAAQEADRTRRYTERVLRGAGEAVVIGARGDRNATTVAWAMKRVTGFGASALQERRWWLVGLVSTALLSLLASLVTAVGLARGVARIKGGLARLEHDFQHQIPETSGELGDIARSINRMVAIRRTLEAELRREDRLRAMGRLVSAVAHEVRNPLNGIKLASQLLKRQIATGQPDPNQADLIVEEVDRLESLVRELLVFDRNQPLKLEPQPIRPAVDRALKLIAAQATRQGIEITVSELTPYISALFDSAHFRQVLLNLLLNSLESLGTGGWVCIEIYANGQAEVRVTDSGAALGPEQRDHLFEMFHSDKPNGVGLGLAVSRELARRMGGDLIYDTEQTHASFLIRLPVPSHARQTSPDCRR